jgi:SNF2 family DNA or RNA helicase
MTVFIEIDGKRILGTFPKWTRREVAHQVSGARAKWDKSGPEDVFLGWTYPLTMDTCYTMRRVFGRDLKVGPQLADWARVEIKKAESLDLFRDGDINQAAAKLLRVGEEAPELYMAMAARPYQLAGAAFMTEGKKVILGDEPGLGKTLQTLAALIETGAQRILVSCPKTATRAVWERETERWAPAIAPFVAQGSPDERAGEMNNFATFVQSGVPSMLIVNHEMLRCRKIEVCPKWGAQVEACTEQNDRLHHHHYEKDPDWPWLFEQEWDAIVVDESHKGLATTKNVQSKGISQLRFGLVQIRRRLVEGGLALALSGTPFRSKLDRAWGTLNWERPDVFGSYWNFAKTYFGVDDSGRNMIVGKEPLDPEAFDQMLRPHYLVRTKKDVLPDLPPIIYAGTPPEDDPKGECYVRLDMDEKQARAYKKMAKEAEAEVEGGTLLANGVLAELTRLRQFANAYAELGSRYRSVTTGQRRMMQEITPTLPSNKIEWIIQFLQEREFTGGKYVIASSFTSIVKLIARQVANEWGEESVLTLTGETGDKARLDLVERFQNPDSPVRVVVLNRDAGGEAITLDAADDMIVVDQPWLSDQDEQLTARIHRVSRIHQVTVHRLVSVGTVDEWMANLTQEQRRILRTAKPKTLSEKVLQALGG